MLGKIGLQEMIKLSFSSPSFCLGLKSFLGDLIAALPRRVCKGTAPD